VLIPPPNCLQPSCQAEFDGEHAAGKGRYGSFLSDISQFYLAYHQEYYGKDKVFLHDPTALLGVTRKDLFEWAEGAVVVAVEGHLRGNTLADSARSRFSCIQTLQHALLLCSCFHHLRSAACSCCSHAIAGPSLQCKHQV
jgi:inosine-uridine nucleoside N-ribohydrolase